MAADFCHAAMGREIALHDHQSTGFLEWLVKRSDDWLSGSFFRLIGLFGESFAGDGKRGAVYALSIEQAFGDHGNSPGVMNVRSDVLARRLQVRKQRSPLAHLLEIINVEFHSHFARDREQMQNGIGRSSGTGPTRNGIVECLFGENVL